MLDKGFEVIQINVVFLRLSAGIIAKISSLSPELDNANTTSLSTIIPKSPCAASAGWTKKAGVPVEANVAAILCPICPDLPMPITIIRPEQRKIASTAATKSFPKFAATSLIAADSVVIATLAQSR